MNNDFTISVIIPTKDRFKDIQICLDSILKQTILPEIIIIVDSSDKNGLREIIENKYRDFLIDFIYIKSKIKSAAIQRNMGIERNENDIIFILDDDIILENNFIESVKDVFKKDKKQEIGAITGKITNTKEMSFISIIIRKFFCLSENNEGKVKKSWSNNGFGKINKISEVEWISGGCSAFRKKVFEYEEFDNHLFGYSYMEDVDISYRIGRKFKLIYNPFAKCIHNHKSSPSTRLKSKEKQKIYMRNYQYFFKKNMPQTFSYKFCHYWSYLGYLIRGLILERDLGFIVGTIEGIFINSFGKNELVEKIRKENEK